MRRSRNLWCNVSAHGLDSSVSSSVSFRLADPVANSLILFAGIVTFLIIRMWFGKAVQDFNASIVAQGQQGPKLIASIGNAFTSESVCKASYLNLSSLSS